MGNGTDSEPFINGQIFNACIKHSSYAVGILIMMPANIAPLPGEGLIEAIAIAADRKFSSVKICIDSSMVIITVILCWIFLGDVLGSVSAGTIISAACTGFVVRQFHDLYRYFTGKDIRVVNKE